MTKQPGFSRFKITHSSCFACSEWNQFRCLEKFIGKANARKLEGGATVEAHCLEHIQINLKVVG